MVQAKQQIKVCIIAPNFLEPHAWMVSAYKTAKLLSQNGFKVIVLTSKTKGSKSFEKIGKVKVYRAPCMFIPDPFNYTFVPFFTFHLKKLIEKENPDVFINNKYMFWTSLSAIYLKIKGKKVITQTDTFPGINWFARSKLLNAFMWVYSRTLGKLILRISDKVIILHEGLIPTAQKLKLNYKVIHNGVDFKKYTNVKPAKDILKIKGKKTLVVYIGRLDAVKGYDTLLKTVEKVNNKNLHFLFVCGEKYPEKRKQLQEKYKNATFLGFRKDIPEILAASDIYVLPSFAEGLPNTLMEAMASGKASVASNVGGVKILVKDNEDGLLVKKGNWKQLNEKIELLARNKNLREKFGKNARKKIEKEFSFGAIGKEWQKILKEK